MAKGKKIRRSSYSYSYRKKKNKSRKILIYILVIVIMIAVGYFGAKLIFGRNDDSKDDKESLTSSVQSQTTSKDTEQEKEEEPEKEAEQDILKACVMSCDAVIDTAEHDAFLNNAKAQGYSGVIVDLKDENGVLYYKSDVELAVQKDVMSDKAVDLKLLFDKINSAGLTPVARIVTLQDNLASYGSDATFLYDDTSSRWLDGVPGNGGKGWLNPYTQKARDYIAELCSEISAAGFKTIILDKLQFPANMSSHTNTLDTNNISKSEILKQLADELNAKAEPNGTQIVCQFGAENFFDVNNGIYGGVPSNITSGMVAVSVDAERLSSINLPQELDGIDLVNSPESSLRELAEYIKGTNDGVMFIVSDSVFSAVKTANEDSGIMGFVVN